MAMERPIAQLARGETIEGFYLLRDASVRTSGSGKPYLSAVLADRTGAVDAKAWDYAGPVGAQDAGKVVKVRGTVTEFRGALQLTVEKLRLAAPADRVELSRLVPAAPIDTAETLRRTLALVESIEDADYRAVCLAMYERHAPAFSDLPAGKSMHHAFLHGLLMHTAAMLSLADFLAGLYPDTVDRSLLLAGTFLHDFGKEAEFALSPLGLATDYTPRGQLLGHLVMGAQETAEVARSLGVPEEKTMLLQHLILSHHGQPEYGAAVRPQCAESELLSYIDLIDSRMEICRAALAETAAGTFSERIFALDNRRMYHHE